MNTHTIIAEMRQDMSKAREDADNQNRVVSDMRMYQCSQLILTTA